MTAKKHHLGATGNNLSDYELYIVFVPGSKKKNMTYRSDLTLAFYRSLKYPFTSGMQALLFKLQNCAARTKRATLYDNTGEVKRNVILEIVDGEIVTNLTQQEVKLKQ